MIGFGEEGFTVEFLSDSFMLGEFKTVIEGNGMDERLERFEKRKTIFRRKSGFAGVRNRSVDVS